MNALVPDGLPAEVRHHRLEVSGAQLAVVEVGDPAAAPVLLAHGAGSSARFVCDAFAHAVVARGNRLVTYDLRGHGASSPSDEVDEHHLDVHVADLIEVAFDLDGELAAIGGISLGGHAAVRMVASGALRPDAVLACLPAWTGAATAGSGPHAAVAAEIRAVGVGGVIDRLRSDVDLPAWLRTTLVTDYERHHAASLEAALIALEAGDAPSDAELASLPVPLAAVAWPDDPGHPDHVATHWVDTAPWGALGHTHLDDLDGDVGALGRVAMQTVDRAIAADGSRRRRA